MKNILTIILLFAFIVAIGQTSTPIKTNYDFKKGFKVTGGNAEVPVGNASGEALQKSQLDSFKVDTVSIRRYISGTAGKLAKFNTGDTTLRAATEGTDYYSPSTIVSPLLYQLQQVQPDSIKANATAIFATGFGTAAYTLVDGTPVGAMVVIEKSVTISKIKYLTGTAGTFTGDNTNSIGLYKKTGDTYNMVASTGNNEGFWKVANSNIATATFTTPYSADAGIYAVLFLYNCSGAAGTTPTLLSNGVNFSSVSAKYILGYGSMPCFTLTSSATALPESFTTIAGSTAAGVVNSINFYLY